MQGKPFGDLKKVLGLHAIFELKFYKKQTTILFSLSNASVFLLTFSSVFFQFSSSNSCST